MNDARREGPGEGAIAIIGWACRFPGATDPEGYWRLLRNGIASISAFSDEEMLDAGVPPALLEHPHYVKAGAILENVDQFDASFFGLTPKEAAIMDPQQRIFLECVWEALERAGYLPACHDGAIGLFAGCGMNHYFLRYLLANPWLLQNTDELQLSIANDRDFFATRIAYLLDLKGPAVNVQTACSTSLVAVHMACQSLLAGESDLALAGGVSIRVPQKTGYLYREGRISSSDGRCRPFDARADGCIGGNGAGVVVLKPWEDALRDGDRVHALILGTAINNDGSQKVSYTAPSVAGQAEVISVALAAANVEPATIAYVEAHGTGTELGDPIEIKALTQAFGTGNTGRCAVGSVKSNMGHLNAAAGIAGLIKVGLALEKQELPPSLGFSEPNPMIDFANSPFFVQTRHAKWPARNGTRRAGVSSFGMGGTNAHAVLEEAPEHRRSAPASPPHLLVLSAKSEAALALSTLRLRDYLEGEEPAPIQDIAFTLQVGRAPFPHRAFAVCGDRREAAERLSRPESLASAVVEAGHRSPVFLFPGQGTQHPGMAANLYATEPVFREWLDFCLDFLDRRMDLDLRPFLFPATEKREEAEKVLARTTYAQPALFSVEFALAQFWRSLGIEPEAMIGHSMGEITAAACAEVFTPEDALEWVTLRGRYMEAQPAGAMLSVLSSPGRLASYLGSSLSLAAINAPEQCTVSGPPQAIEDLMNKLAAEKIAFVRLPGSRAFHSPMMAPAAGALLERLRRFSLSPPVVPFISNLTGDYIKPEQATDPAYWARQLQETVLFSPGLSRVLSEKGRVLMEIGPGKVLSGLARKHMVRNAGSAIVETLPFGKSGMAAPPFAETLGRVWLTGLPVRWNAWRRDAGYKRVPLPTYPFERQRHWIEPQTGQDPRSWRADAGRDQEPPPFPGSAKTKRPTSVPYESPRNPLEEELAGICERVLGVVPVGIHDPFFEIGGDSLLATQVTAHIHDGLEPLLPPKALFEHPTVARLAELIETLRWAHGRREPVEDPTHEREQGSL